MALQRHAELHARSERLEQRLPAWIARAVKWLRTSSAWVRYPAAVLLMIGGVFGFLPILGFWMIPLGVILVAQDLPVLHGPVIGMLKRVESWLR